MKPRLLFVVNDPGFFVSHRLPIAFAARQAGFDTHVATMAGEAVEAIYAAGFVHHVIPLSRSGKHPLLELRCFFSIFWLFIKLRPSLVHLVTIKPVLYGGLAARIARVPGVIAAVSGLGHIFVDNRKHSGVARLLVLTLYRFALKIKNIKVIFQNPDDRASLVSHGIISTSQTALIPGSGVDLAEYQASLEPEGVPVVVLTARLLKSKGVIEFVEAANILKRKGMVARFALVGSPDFGNPTSVTQKELDLWVKDGAIELWGFRTDIPVVFKQSNIVVLPSYGEGFPKVLIEAAACARAVVTTDVPGCRDSIESDITGLLVPPRNVNELAQAIERLIADPVLRKKMGAAGRQRAEKLFSIDSVIHAHMDIYRQLLSTHG